MSEAVDKYCAIVVEKNNTKSLDFLVLENYSDNKIGSGVIYDYTFLRHWIITKTNFHVLLISTFYYTI